MKFFSYPVLKFRTSDKLFISKNPGILSWAALFAIALLVIVLDYYFIPDYFLIHAGFLLLCLISSLNLMKTWDLIMDKEENLGTVINQNWYHAFSISVPEKNIERFLLSTITSVIVTSDTSIEIKRQNEESIIIKSDSRDYRLLKNLRREISTFLSLERMEDIKNSETHFMSGMFKFGPLDEDDPTFKHKWNLQAMRSPNINVGAM